jgi:DNA (cytosine-5)-methyltransferase 1
MIGWQKESRLRYPDFQAVECRVIVNDLFQDLPKLLLKTREQLPRNASAYVRDNGIRSEADVLTHPISRPNAGQDIKIYKKAIELWNDGHKRFNYNDLPEDLKTHRNRTSLLIASKWLRGVLSLATSNTYS